MLVFLWLVPFYSKTVVVSKKTFFIHLARCRPTKRISPLYCPGNIMNNLLMILIIDLLTTLILFCSGCHVPMCWQTSRYYNFHMQHKKNFYLDGQTRQAKVSSQPVNLHDAWSSINAPDFCVTPEISILPPMNGFGLTSTPAHIFREVSFPSPPPPREWV